MKARRQKRIPTLNALGKCLVELRRKHPAISDDAVLAVLNAPVIEGGTILEWLAYCDRITANGREKERQESWKKWRRMDQQILSVVSNVKAAPITGGPRRCDECGARDPGERTVWCVSGCPPSLDEKGRKDRILAELEAARWLRGHAGPIPPYIAGRGERSRLAWLPETAARLAEYLGRATETSMHSLYVYRMTVCILMLAYPREKITTQMVKGQLNRRARRLRRVRK